MPATPSHAPMRWSGAITEAPAAATAPASARRLVSRVSGPPTFSGWGFGCGELAVGLVDEVGGFLLHLGLEAEAGHDLAEGRQVRAHLLG